jgi:hypothetical protein
VRQNYSMRGWVGATVCFVAIEKKDGCVLHK